MSAPRERQEIGGLDSVIRQKWPNIITFNDSGEPHSF